MRNSILAALAGAVVMACAGQAAAHVYTIDFTISGLWNGDTANPPYGLSSNPTLTGSLTGDSSLLGTQPDNGAETITSINFVTGTKTWTLADLDTWGSSVSFGGTPAGDPTSFTLMLGGFTTIYSNNAAWIGDGRSTIVCGNCVTLSGDVGVGSPAPEPATWAMMLLGFFATAALLRSDRRLNLSSPSLPACA